MSLLFFAGVICAIIGIALNENFFNNPSLLDYNVLKGLLSHSTMLIGCIYILVGKFIKIRVSNTVSVFFGLCLFLIVGFTINGLFAIFELSPVNSMYLQKIPFESLAWINTYVMGLFGMVLVFIITAIYEQIFVKKDNRWYKKIKNKQI